MHFVWWNIALLIAAALLGVLAVIGLSVRGKHSGHKRLHPLLGVLTVICLIIAGLSVFGVLDFNSKPAANVASFTYNTDPTDETEGLTAYLDASASKDAAGPVTSDASAALIKSGEVKITWIFDTAHKTAKGETGTGITPTHVYAKDGTYQVEETITQKGQPTKTTTKSVIVKKGTAEGGGTIDSPRDVALGDVGLGQCIAGNGVLTTLQKQKPSGDTFQLASYTTSTSTANTEFATMATSEEAWITTHKNDACIVTIAKNYGEKDGVGLAAYMDKEWHVGVVPSGGLVVQNSYYTKDGKLIWWDVQRFPAGELVWFDAKGVPQMKYVCGNLLRVPKPPKPTPTTSPTAPSTHPGSTPIPTPSTTKPGHTPTPTPTKTPTPKPKPTPTPTKTPKSPPNITDKTVPQNVQAGQSRANTCVWFDAPAGDSVKVTFGANIGSFSLVTVTTTASAGKVCSTYTAPNDAAPNLTDYITYTVLDTTTGLHDTVSTQSFNINPAPTGGGRG